MLASAGLIREAGGLGDVIRMGVVGGALKRRGIDHVVAYGLAQFKQVFLHLDGIDEFVPVPLRIEDRRTRSTPWSNVAYLLDCVRPDHAKLVDLFCPGWVYEMSVRGPVELNRTECFLRAANIELGANEDPRPRWKVPPKDNADLAAVMPPGNNIVGVALGATDPARVLPNPQAAELVARLNAAGFQVWVLDNQRRLPDLPVAKWVVNAPIEAVATVMSRMKALVAVDSGLLHLAGALDLPTIGLFGPTDPKVMLKHYPFARGLTGYGWDDPQHWSPCRQACWFRTDRGWNPPSCRGSGCHWMHRLSMREVVDALQALVGSCEVVA